MTSKHIQLSMLSTVKKVSVKACALFLCKLMTNLFALKVGVFCSLSNLAKIGAKNDDVLFRLIRFVLRHSIYQQTDCTCRFKLKV